MRNVWVRAFRKTQLSQNWIPKICGAVKRTMTLEDEAGKKLRKKTNFKKWEEKYLDFKDILGREKSNDI